MNWPMSPVVDLCSLIVDCVNKTAPTVDGPTIYRMIRTTNIKHGRIDLSTCKYVEETTYTKWTRRAKLLSGDVILTREAPLGEIGFVRQDSTDFLGQRIMQYRANPEKMLPRFLYYAFRSPVVQAQIHAHSGSGSVVDHIRVPECAKFRIPVPPLEVQKHVSEVLASIDDKIELNLKMNETLEQMARAIFKSWFIDFDPVHAKRQGKKPFGMDDATAALFPDSFAESEIGKIPNGWSVRLLGDYVDTVSETFKFSVGQQVIFLNTSDILNGEVLVSEYSEASGLPGQAKKKIRHGDILFSEIRPSNKRHVLVDFDGSDYVVSTKLMVLRSKGIDPVYPYFLLTLPETMAHLQHLAESRSGTFPQITFDQVKPLKLCMPNEDVLERFISILKALYGMMSHLRRESKTLGAMRDLLLPRLLSGELTIKEAPT